MIHFDTSFNTGQHMKMEIEDLNIYLQMIFCCCHIT